MLWPHSGTSNKAIFAKLIGPFQCQEPLAYPMRDETYPSACKRSRTLPMVPPPRKSIAAAEIWTVAVWCPARAGGQGLQSAVRRSANESGSDGATVL